LRRELPPADCPLITRADRAAAFADTAFDTVDVTCPAVGVFVGVADHRVGWVLGGAGGGVEVAVTWCRRAASSWLVSCSRRGRRLDVRVTADE